MSDNFGGFCAFLPPDVDPLVLTRAACSAILGTSSDEDTENERAPSGETFLVLDPDPKTGAVAIELSGEVGPGRGEASEWYFQRTAFAELLSSELGIAVYVWGYENQVGGESLEVIENGSSVDGRDTVIWDADAGRRKDDWPLSRLALALGTTRSELEHGLGGPERLRIDVETRVSERERLRAELKALRERQGGLRPAPPNDALMEKIRDDQAHDHRWSRRHRDVRDRLAIAKPLVPVRRADPKAMAAGFAGAFVALLLAPPAAIVIYDATKSELLAALSLLVGGALMAFVTFKIVGHFSARGDS